MGADLSAVTGCGSRTLRNCGLPDKVEEKAFEDWASNQGQRFRVDLGARGSRRVGFIAEPENGRFVVQKIHIDDETLVSRWNRANPESRVELQDILVSVNGISGEEPETLERMLEQLQSAKQLALTVERQGLESWLGSVTAFQVYAAPPVYSAPPSVTSAPSTAARTRGLGTAARHDSGSHQDPSPIGDRVFLRNFRDNPEYNGKAATIVRWNAARKEWIVTLDDSTDSFGVRPQFLSAPQGGRLQSHARVLLVNLQSSAEYNGSRGTVVRWSERQNMWIVRLDSCNDEFEDVCVPRFNLELL